MRWLGSWFQWFQFQWGRMSCLLGMEPKQTRMKLDSSFLFQLGGMCFQLGKKEFEPVVLGSSQLA